MSKSSPVSVILPAKNEAEHLLELLPRIRALPGADQWELICVNDGSTDTTSDVLAQFDVTEIKQPYSKGNGAAVKAGARAAGGEILVFLDADGQHRPEDIPGLLQRYEAGFDMVVGARPENRSGHASSGRWLANRIYNKLATWMTGHPILDLTSGFRVVNAKRFREFLSFLPNGFSYPTTITMAFFRVGYSVAYQPVTMPDRNGSSHIDLWRDGVKFLLIIFRVGTLYSPLKLFFPVSFLIGLSAMAYFTTVYVATGRFTNMTVVMILAAILVFVFGLLSEQVTTLLYKDNHNSNERD